MGEKHVFWASQTSFMLQSTAKSSAMVPRMIGTMLFLGQKSTKNRFFWPKPWGGPFKIAQKWVFWAQKHSKTLKNTQKHSKTLKNTPNMPGITRKTPNFAKRTNPSAKAQKRVSSP